MTKPLSHPQAAFFDLDGTLAVHNAAPSQEDTEAIRAFRSRGNKVFLNTGRSLGFLYSSILDIGFDGIVAGAGAYARIGEKVIWRQTLSSEAVERVIQYFARSGDLCILEGETGMFQVGRSLNRPFDWPDIRSYTEFTDRFPGQAITKLSIFAKPDDTLRKMLGADFSLIEHSDYAEAVPAGCSKSDGMLRVLKALRMEREDSIAFGDSMNDYDMIQCAGTGIAMGNAVEAVKAAADQVTLPYDQSGVAYALWRIMEKGDAEFFAGKGGKP